MTKVAEETLSNGQISALKMAQEKCTIFTTESYTILDGKCIESQ